MSDSISVRFGTLIQPTFDATQDANSEGYSQNWYLRRVRLIMLTNVGPAIQVFLQTDDTRVGNAGVNGQKNVNTGFQLVDAWAQWAFAGDTARLMAGLFYVPSVRTQITSNATTLSIDLPTWMQQQGATLQATNTRDYGVGVNGFLWSDRLAYRVGVFSGARAAPTQQPPLGASAGSRNPPRVAGRIAYDFFDAERSDTGYNYSGGTYLGKKKVLAVGVVGDGQGDYRGYGGDVFLDWPLGMDAITAEADYFHYDGHEEFADGIPEQHSWFAVAGYYLAAIKLQPYVRYERLDYASQANRSKEQQRFGGGFNYYVMGQNLKLTAAYERIIPKVQPAGAVVKNTNRFVFQVQGYYF